MSLNPIPNPALTHKRTRVPNRPPNSRRYMKITVQSQNMRVV